MKTCLYVLNIVLHYKCDVALRYSLYRAQLIHDEHSLFAFEQTILDRIGVNWLARDLRKSAVANVNHHRVAAARTAAAYGIDEAAWQRTLRAVCAWSAQDRACFGYDLPAECAGVVA
jgi:hypothetical protein